MSAADQRARPRRARWLLPVSILACLAGCMVVGSALLVYLRSTRTTLVPSGPARAISTDQAQLLLQELAKHPAHSLTVKTDGSDREANQFAHQLYDTLRGSQWHVDLITDDTGPGIGTGLWIAQTGEDARPAYSDPSQDPYFFLANALHASHIDLAGELGQSYGDFKLYLVVGHRELQAPVARRSFSLRDGARWLLRHLKKL